MGNLPELITSATIHGGRPAWPLGRTWIDFQFSRRVAGTADGFQTVLGRVLSVDARQMWVRPYGVFGDSLREPAVGQLERGGTVWELRRWEKLADFTGLRLELAALAVRDSRGNPRGRDETIANLSSEIRDVGGDVPAFVWRELGQALASAGRDGEADEALSKAIGAGCAQEAMALAVRASVRMRAERWEAAEADITTLGSVEGVADEDDGQFGPDAIALHARFLRGLLASRRGQEDEACALLELIVADAGQCDADVAQHQTLSAAGALVSTHVFEVERVKSTLDPELTRYGRSATARRALSSIALGRREHARALEWLAPLTDAIDILARARILIAHDRPGEAMSVLKTAQGNPEAVTLLLDLQKKAALRAPSKATSEVDTFETGARVQHPRFGEGTIEDTEEQNGRILRVVVAFDDGTTRTLPKATIRLA